MSIARIKNYSLKDKIRFRWGKDMTGTSVRELKLKIFIPGNEYWESQEPQAKTLNPKRRILESLTWAINTGKIEEPKRKQSPGIKPVNKLSINAQKLRTRN